MFKLAFAEQLRNVIALLLMLPLLMAPDCVSFQTSLNDPGKVEYCLEDIPIKGLAVATLPNAGSNSAAMVSMYDLSTATARILQKFPIRPGDSIAVSTSIPWAYVSGSRNAVIIVSLDVASVPDSYTVGSVISAASLNKDVQNLAIYARATRSFHVCK